MCDVALVTGSSRGIGYGIAKELHKQGCEVVLVARDKQKLSQIKKDFKQRCHYIPLDLLAKNALGDLLSFLEINKISPNIVIHNVGGRLECDSQPLSYKALMQSIDMNLGIAVKINQSLIPKMKENREGSIVHISSDSALNGNGAPGYVAAKAGLNAYIKSTARFYAKDNLCINGVMPGIIDFEGSAWDIKRTKEPLKYTDVKARQAIGRFGSVEEIAEFVAFLALNKNLLTTGEIFCLNGAGGGGIYNVFTHQRGYKIAA